MTDRDLLNRYLDGELAPADAARLEARLATEASLLARLERLRALRGTLTEARVDSFAPFFSDRVMKRLMPARATADVFYEGIRFAFARMAVAGLAVAGVLAVYNLLTYGDLGVASSIPDALFGLPSASLLDALTYGAY